MLNFLAPNPPSSPGADDPLMFLFSSPATDVDESAIQQKLANLPHHPSNQIPSVSNPTAAVAAANAAAAAAAASASVSASAALVSRQQHAAQLDSLLASSGPAPTLYDPSITAAYQIPMLSDALPDPSATHAPLAPSTAPPTAHASVPVPSPSSASAAIPATVPSMAMSMSMSMSAPLSTVAQSSVHPPTSITPRALPKDEPITHASSKGEPLLQPVSHYPVHGLPIGPAVQTHSTATASASASASGVGLVPSMRAPRRAKRARSLEVMKALAHNHAPDVSLSESELLAIGRMHESDQQLAASRALYSALAAFKRALGAHGYRLTALHVDSTGKQEQADIPFDFVLNKKVVPDRSSTSAGATGASAAADGTPAFVPGEDPLAMAAAAAAAAATAASTGPPSASPSSSDSSFDGDDADAGDADRGSSPPGLEDGADVGDEVEDGGNVSGKEMSERPRKRARMSTGGDCSPPGSPRNRFGCAVCGKLIADRDTLIRHFRHTHQELKPFSCPRCRGHYSSEGTLWHHIRNVHTETPRKYKCAYCDASYDSFGAKTRHEHATHNTGSPQFVCSFEGCRRAFNFPAHLEAHALQMHPGFRPFQCSECPKSFPSANGLTRHAREVHVRPQSYSCSCSKSYSKRCHLKRHLLRVHGMSVERVQEEMNKQPHPGLLHMVPPAPPASTD